MLILVVYIMLVAFIAFSNIYLFYFLILIVSGFYHLAFEVLNNGQSPGKKIMSIKVVTLHGRTPKAQDYFLRWIFRLLEITGCLGVVAILYVSSTEKNQRIGDLLAQTTVVKLRNKQIFDLKGLIRMGDKKRKIKYPKVVMYNDTDMMLVKDALARIKKNPNERTDEFLDNLTNKIADDLDENIDLKRRTQFFRNCPIRLHCFDEVINNKMKLTTSF